MSRRIYNNTIFFYFTSKTWQFLIHVTFTLLQGQTASCSLHKMIKYFKQFLLIPPTSLLETDTVIVLLCQSSAFVIRACIYEISIAPCQMQITDVLWAVLDGLSGALINADFYFPYPYINLYHSATYNAFVQNAVTEAVVILSNIIPRG